MMLLLIHAGATLYMTGLIWFVQVVHYPLMARVGEDGFAEYEKHHQRLTTWVVAPPMAAGTAPLEEIRTLLRTQGLVAPDEAGSYLLTWDLFQAGEWLSARGVAVLQRPVQMVAPEYGVDWEVLAPWPAWMRRPAS